MAAKTPNFDDSDVARIALLETQTAVVITDLHLNRCGTLQSDVNELLNHIRQLIKFHHPTCFICLGDIIHRNEHNKAQLWVSFFKQLEKFAIPFHIISGNHDARYAGFISYYWSGHYVHWYGRVALLRLDFVRIDPQTFKKTRSETIYFGHDVKQTFIGSLVSDGCAWMKKVRAPLQPLIGTHLLVLGHVHYPWINQTNDGTTLSLSPFSGHIGEWMYGLVQRQVNSLSFIPMINNQLAMFDSVS